jgi:hypothetical protein
MMKFVKIYYNYSGLMIVGTGFCLGILSAQLIFVTKYYFVCQKQGQNLRQSLMIVL